MKRIPLSQLSLLTHSNSIQNQSFNNKLVPAPNSDHFSDTTQSKNEPIISFENLTSFDDLQPSKQGGLFERIDRDMESPLSSPNKTSSSKSSIIKKSIKKEKNFETSTKNSKRLKTWLKLRQRKINQTQGLSRQPSFNITYKNTPKKLLSQIMDQEEINQEFKDVEEFLSLQGQRLLVVKENSACTSISNQSVNEDDLLANSPRVESAEDKNIYLLNSIPDNVKKVKISGISVFFGDDDHTYAFPSDKKTVKYLV